MINKSVSPQASPRIALLTDAECSSPSWIPIVLEKATTHGRLIVKRVYGDFDAPGMTPWKGREINRLLLNEGIEKRMTTRYCTGKNSSDLAIAIGAMDIFHGKLADELWLIGGDRDYAQLAFRLQEDNFPFRVFGPRNTSPHLRAVCTSFEEIDYPTPTIPRTRSGSICRLHFCRPFGSIRQDNGGADLFFCASELIGCQFDELRCGDAVTYEIGKNNKGPCAAKVRRILVRPGAEAKSVAVVI